MNRRFFPFGAMLLALAGGNAAAQGGDTANDLLRSCKLALTLVDGGGAPSGLNRSQSLEAGFCFGLMQGMTNTAFAHQKIATDKSSVIFCPPENMNNGQAVRIVIKYLEEHPETLHRNSVAVAFRAFEKAFPCE